MNAGHILLKFFHIQKGETMKKVQTIKNAEKLQEIQEGLSAATDAHGRRMYLFFMCGIYTGLRVSDLVRLKAGNVRGEEIILTEKKTGKEQIIPIATVLQKVVANRTQGMSDDDYLFPSRSNAPDGKPWHITTRSAYDDMRSIAAHYGLRGSIGCHTLRKTFGY